MDERVYIDGETAGNEENGIYKFTIKNSEKGDDIVSSIEQRKTLEQISAAKSLLPIGSVISKEKNDKKFMIIGHMYNGYDYILCKYPEGISAGQSLIGISKNDVVRIYNVGYIDNKDINHREQLVNGLNK